MSVKEALKRRRKVAAICPPWGGGADLGQIVQQRITIFVSFLSRRRSDRIEPTWGQNFKSRGTSKKFPPWQEMAVWTEIPARTTGETGSLSALRR